MRENLAFGGTIVLKWFILLVVGLLLISGVFELLFQNNDVSLIDLIELAAILVIIHPVSDVYIQDDHIVCQRWIERIYLDAAAISDVNYSRFLPLLKITLKTESDFGRSIYFFPHNDGNFVKDEYGDGKIFERIGRFCGWKNR